MRFIIVIFYFFYVILSICNICDALKRQPSFTTIGAFRESVTDFRPAHSSARRNRRHGGGRKADVLECIQRCRRLLDRSLLRIGLTATAVTAEYGSRLPESASAAAVADAPTTNKATGERQPKETNIRSSKYFNDICWKYFDYSDCIKQCETTASFSTDAVNMPLDVSSMQQRSLHKRRMEAIATSLLGASGSGGDRTFFLATNTLLKDCRASTPPETMSQFRCIHRYHTFLDVQCSSYAHEALRLVREQAGNVESGWPHSKKRRSLSSLAAEKDGDTDANTERKSQIVVNEEICRFLHYHSMCLANSVVQFCPSTAVTPRTRTQQATARQEDDSSESDNDFTERRPNVGAGPTGGETIGSDPNDGAAALFNRFTLRDYFLSFVLPLRDQERYFTDRVLDECQLYDFQKIAKDIYASTKSSRERTELPMDRSTKDGADGWRTTTVKRRSLFDLFFNGKEHLNITGVPPPMETDTLRSTLFSSYEDLTDTPPNFYYSSAKYPTHLLTYYTNHQTARTTPQSFALLDGDGDRDGQRHFSTGTGSSKSVELSKMSEERDVRADSRDEDGDDERVPLLSSTVVVTFPDRHPQVDWTSANAPRGASKKTVELNKFSRHDTTASATVSNVWLPTEDSISVTSTGDDAENRRQTSENFSLHINGVEEALPTVKPRVAAEKNGNDLSTYGFTWPDDGLTIDNSRNAVGSWSPTTALTFSGPEMASTRLESEGRHHRPSSDDSAGGRSNRPPADVSSPKFVIFHGNSEEEESEDSVSLSDRINESGRGADDVPSRTGTDKLESFSWFSSPPTSDPVGHGVGSPSATPLLPVNSRVHVKKIVRFTESSRSADSDAESAEYLERPNGGRRKGGGGGDGADGSRSSFPDDSYSYYGTDDWDYDGDYDAYYDSREYTTAGEVDDMVTPSSLTTIYDKGKPPSSAEDGGEDRQDDNDDRYYYEPYEISTASVTADEKTFYASIGKNPPPSRADAREQHDRHFPTSSVVDRFPTRRFGNNRFQTTASYDDDDTWQHPAIKTGAGGSGVQQQWRPDTALILLGLYFVFFSLVALALLCVGAAYAWRRLRWRRLKTSSLVSSIMGGSLCPPHERL